MPYIKLSDFVYDCRQCHTRCDGRSKGVYRFEADATFSEHYEQIIIDRINRSSQYTAAKSALPGYPDIEIKKTDGSLHHYLEVKVQQRTFMGIEKHLPESKLLPSETVALNLSDLLRYFKIEAETTVSTSLVWVLLNRLCLVNQNQEKMFFQKVSILKSIYEAEQLRRKFTRKSGEGDVVDGIHKGVIVNYHFSLKELKNWTSFA